MAWQDQLTIIVRTLINDLSSPYEFSDDRLQQVIVVAAQFVQFDVNLNCSYSIDVVNPAINPDPTVNNDKIFISLTALKSACIVDQGTFRTKAALEGIKTSLGSSHLSIGGNISGYKSIIEHGACAAYDELVSQWDVSNATAIAAVLSPFVGNNFDPRYLLRGSFRNTDSNDFYS
jgi:hypothetical protein